MKTKTSISPNTCSSAELFQLLAEAPTEEAWQEIISRFASGMLQTAYALLGDRALAEDAVQDSLVYMITSDRLFNKGREITDTYVRNSLLNLSASRAKDIIRERERRKKREGNSIKAQRLNSTTTTTEPAQTQYEQLRKILADLPEKMRHPLELKFFTGLNDNELAKHLSCSPNAARIRIHRALKHIQKRFASVGTVVVLTAISSEIQTCMLPHQETQQSLALMSHAYQEHIERTVEHISCTQDTSASTSVKTKALLALAIFMLTTLSAWVIIHNTTSTENTIAEAAQIPAQQHSGKIVISEIAEEVVIGPYNPNWRNEPFGDIGYTRGIDAIHIMQDFKRIIGTDNITLVGYSQKEFDNMESGSLDLSGTTQQALNLFAAHFGFSWKEKNGELLITRSDTLTEPAHALSLTDLAHNPDTRYLSAITFKKVTGSGIFNGKGKFRYACNAIMFGPLWENRISIIFAAGARHLEFEEVSTEVAIGDSVVDYLTQFEDQFDIDIRFQDNAFVIYSASERSSN